MTDSKALIERLLDQSRANFERQFDHQVFAEWVYDDLRELFAAELYAHIEKLEADKARLREALEEWMFRYYWRVDELKTGIVGSPAALQETSQC